MKNKRPILFSTPMVQALLEGRKTQTRRIIKEPNNGVNTEICEIDKKAFAADECGVWKDRISPYGKVGDLLWVRETFAPSPAYIPRDCLPNVSEGQGYKAIYYRATSEHFAWGMYGEPKWKPSIFMPRTASRITLEITNIRVEKLKDISSGDAIAEGIELNGDFGYKDYLGKGGIYSNAPRPSYFSLWEKINGKGSVEKNPWVWVLEFKVHKINVDKM